MGIAQAAAKPKAKAKASGTKGASKQAAKAAGQPKAATPKPSRTDGPVRKRAVRAGSKAQATRGAKRTRSQAGPAAQDSTLHGASGDAKQPTPTAGKAATEGRAAPQKTKRGAAKPAHKQAQKGGAQKRKAPDTDAAAPSEEVAEDDAPARAADAHEHQVMPVEAAPKRAKRATAASVGACAEAPTCARTASTAKTAAAGSKAGGKAAEPAQETQLGVTEDKVAAKQPLSTVQLTGSRVAKEAMPAQQPSAADRKAAADSPGAQPLHLQQRLTIVYIVPFIPGIHYRAILAQVLAAPTESIPETADGLYQGNGSYHHNSDAVRG